MEGRNSSTIDGFLNVIFRVDRREHQIPTNREVFSVLCFPSTTLQTISDYYHDHDSLNCIYTLHSIYSLCIYNEPSFQCICVNLTIIAHSIYTSLYMLKTKNVIPYVVFKQLEHCGLIVSDSVTAFKLIRHSWVLESFSFSDAELVLFVVCKNWQFSHSEFCFHVPAVFLLRSALFFSLQNGLLSLH